MKTRTTRLLLLISLIAFLNGCDSSQDPDKLRSFHEGQKLGRMLAQHPQVQLNAYLEGLNKGYNEQKSLEKSFSKESGAKQTADPRFPDPIKKYENRRSRYEEPTHFFPDRPQRFEPPRNSRLVSRKNQHLTKKVPKKGQSKNLNKAPDVKTDQ